LLLIAGSYLKDNFLIAIGFLMLIIDLGLFIYAFLQD